MKTETKIMKNNNRNNNLKISFKVLRLPFYCVAAGNGLKTLEIQCKNSDLTVSVWYDLKQEPLNLTGAISQGDKIQIVLYDCRIELYINGEIADEEWPMGNRLYSAKDTFFPDEKIEVRKITEQKAVLPNAVSTFKNAEGWYPGNGVFVGDCMPYSKDGEYHILYLKDRHHHNSKWGLGAHQWEHISTADFETWRIHPMAVPISESWEGSICTGSWIRREKNEYLYYTIRRADGMPASICRSASVDGFNFVKDKKFGFSISEKYDAVSARDPKVFQSDDGLFHMLITTSLVKKRKGCLAHYVSGDMEKWEELEPIYVSDTEEQPECPDYFKYCGKYYLIFSLQRTARYMLSDQPFGGFKIPDSPFIPCACVPKAAEWKGRMIFAGFQPIGNYAGSLALKAAVAAKNGELLFEDCNALKRKTTRSNF